ncbi:MAG: chromosomal replication initiator protein DnaA [Bacteroidales bacterium]|nr:chromosomal replication initiator protein DnaA [Bacteroidales bacterium]
MSEFCVEIWNNCLKMIQENTRPQSYKTWFEPIKPVAYEEDENVLTIQVPSQFFYEYLETQYISLLKLTIHKILGPTGRLKYSIVMDNYGSDNPLDIKVPTTDRTNTVNPAVRVPINFEDEQDKQVLNPFVLPGINKIKVESQLNENYSFDNFIEGDCNRLARSAGLAVAERPGKTAFNPLFIYSQTGLGKTHLCHAIGLETKKYHPNLVVLYVNAEQFVQQFLSSCNPQKNTRRDFIHFYQMIDVLIIDDIQFLSGKKAATQEAFFHIFNHLQQNGKQLIFASDKAPVELKDMEPRLLSRFKWGLSADMQAPDIETRIRILKRKAFSDGIELPEEVIDYVASRVKSNVREMEGLFISLIAQSSLNKKAITLDLARQLVERFVHNSTQEVSIEYIVNVVCNHLNIPIEVFYSKSKKREMVQARQLAMHFAKKYTKCSLAAIGQQCGGKDHATVIHALKTVANLLETDKQFRTLATEIEKNIC